MIDHKPNAVESAVLSGSVSTAERNALRTAHATANALRTPMNREQTAHTTANQTDSSTLKRRCRSGGLSLAKQRERFSAFTLAELVLSMGALVLLVLLTTQLLDSAATIMTLGHRQMNADSAARELFDRIAIDFAQMAKRSDVDYYLKSSTTASDCTLCTRQRGNDQIAFYSTVPGWSALAGAQQSPVSIVGYRIHVSADTFSNRMERLGEGLIWNGATSDRRGDGRPASVNFGAPLNPWANATNTPFDVISPDVFRFEYYYVLKNGDLSSIPWYTISSVRGMQDVSAIIVDIAVLDPKSRVLLNNSDITALAQELPDYGGQVPGGLLASWRTILDANRTLPRPALSSVRLYERCFHLCPTAL